MLLIKHQSFQQTLKEDCGGLVQGKYQWLMFYSFDSASP